MAARKGTRARSEPWAVAVTLAVAGCSTTGPIEGRFEGQCSGATYLSLHPLEGLRPGDEALKAERSFPCKLELSARGAEQAVALQLDLEQWALACKGSVDSPSRPLRVRRMRCAPPSESSGCEYEAVGDPIIELTGDGGAQRARFLGTFSVRSARDCIATFHGLEITEATLKKNEAAPTPSR